MIKLAKKKTFMKEWVEMGDGVKFKIDYPTNSQQAKLDELMMEMGSEQNSPLMLRYAKLFIKYTVKDWQGLGDIECKLVNGELQKDLWEQLTTDVEEPTKGIEQTTKIWAKIVSELEFTEADKKK